MEEKIIEILQSINEEISGTRKDENLFLEELLDSIDLMELISELEKTFKIEIHADEIELQNFASIEKIVCFMKEKANHSNHSG